MDYKQIDRQYKPIMDQIATIPEEGVKVDDGLERAKNGYMIKLGLMLVVRNCRFMKHRDVSFPSPFSKSELEDFTTAPFTEKKLNQVRALVKQYAALADKAVSVEGDAVVC